MSEASSNAAPPPSPTLFFETVNAYQRTAALRAAIELGLFTAVAEGDGTLEKLAGASARGVRILADYLTVLGFMTKRNERYALTPDTATFLDRRSPAYVGGAVEFLLAPNMVTAFADVAAAARKGGTVLPEGGTTAPAHDLWVKFARAMGPLMFKAAEGLAQLADPAADRPIKVLDISASHGTYGLAFARRNPQARVVGLDWPNVLEVAKESARKAGVADRYETIAGDAFKVDFGSGYDVILLPNFLHHFAPSQCMYVMKKVHAALKDDGRAATLEFIPDADRVTPRESATFALTMLCSTPAGDAYTFDEYQDMFRVAGFKRNELHDVPGAVQRAILSYKA